MQLQVENSTFSSAPCYASEQARLNGFSAQQFVTLPDGLTNLVISEDQPSVEFQEALWLQTDEFNNPVQYWLFSAQYAAWLWPHPVPVNDERLVLYKGDAADVPTLDGGDALAITETTGSFWEIDTDFTNLIPIGAGTVPVETNAFEFATGTAYPQVRGVYMLQRTARKYLLA